MIHDPGPPIRIKDVKVFPAHSSGGTLPETDVEYVVQAEGVDRLWSQLDVWVVQNAIQELTTSPQIPPMFVYAPIDHHGPEYMLAPISWRSVFDSTDMTVPYCEFGQHVMEVHDVADDNFRLVPVRMMGRFDNSAWIQTRLRNVG